MSEQQLAGGSLKLTKVRYDMTVKGRLILDVWLPEEATRDEILAAARKVPLEEWTDGGSQAPEYDMEILADSWSLERCP
jgi:hypothetical protein